MRGDFSRGFQPDAKRGRDYRRILLQQGRLLLDSDFNAATDAQDKLIRELASDLGCRYGSPDLGFLVTPGVLLALFDPAAGIVPVGNNVEAIRDYGEKYLDRYPSLRLTGLAGGGSVRIPFRTALTGAVTIDVHARADGAAVAAPVTGAGPLNVPAQADFARLTVNLNDPAEMEITLADSEVIWIALIETSLPAGQLPNFGVVGGRYYLEGLSVETPGGLWPEAGFSPVPDIGPSGFVVPDPGGPRPLQAGDRIVAYLEGWERHVTRVEDLGIFEQALGTGPDTCTRSADTGQVKLAPALGLDADAARAAFAARRRGGGTLVVDIAPQLVDPDPCALPVAGGYTGRDHRLYRFEVHVGGTVPNALLKWSRDNGSELFPTLEATAGTITVLAGTPLRHNDLVEILSDTIDLTDAGLAVLDPAQGVFEAPPREVGDLVRLRRMESPPGTQDLLFGLRDPDDTTIPVLLNLARYGDPLAPQLKVRRWHGTIDPAGAPAPFTVELEDGISVTLDGGSFEPGDWWHYEARVARDNANGAWRAEPHGPERLFAPLALLEHQGAGQPLALVAWLDERFSSLCRLDADDIAFDGDKIGSSSDTVQEVIEELWERNVGGCCEVTLDPETAGDDAARIAAAIAEAPADRPLVVCLRRGIYRFETTLPVEGRDIAIHGCPEAVIDGRTNGDPLLDVSAGGSLRLRDLVILAEAAVAAPALVRLRASARMLEAEAVGFANLNPAAEAAVIRVDGDPPLLDDIRDPFTGAPFALGDHPEMALSECSLLGQNGVFGGPLGVLEVTDSFVFAATGGIMVRQISRIACVGSLLQIGTPIGALGATAAELLTAPEPLFEAAAQAFLDAPNADGAAFAALRVQAGSIQRTVMAGSICLAVSQVNRLTLDTNTLFGGAAGIFFKRAGRTRVEGQRIAVLREGGVGLHVIRAADRLAVLANDIEAPEGEGIVLAGMYLEGQLPVADPSLNAVDVCGNTIEARFVGCRLGERSGHFFEGAADLVDISRNQISATELGLSIAGAKPEGEHRFQARATGNTVVAHFGAQVRGQRIDLSGNQFRPTDAGKFGWGILAEASPQIALHGNTVDADKAKGEAGIMLSECDGAVLMDNIVRLDGAPGLQVEQSDRFRASGNLLEGEGAHIKGCSGCELRGNDFGSRAVLDGCADVTLNDNRTVASGPILLTSANGDWQVNDNRAGGDIRFTPAQRFRPGGLTIDPGLLSAHQPAFSARTSPMVRAMMISAGAAPAAANQPTAMLAPNPNAADVSNFLVALPDVSAALRDAVAVEIARVRDDVLVAALPAGRPPIIVARGEVTIRAQFVGNRCTNLFVGNPELKQTSEQSVIHVVANSVGEALGIGQYERRNVSQNIARSFAGPVQPNPASFGADNLDLP